jgi:hypothetical protein
MIKRQFKLKKVYEKNNIEFIQKSIECAYKKNELGQFRVSIDDKENMTITIVCDKNYDYALNNDLSFGISSQTLEDHLNKYVSQFTRQKYSVTEII